MKPIKYIFKKASDAKKFSSSITNAGINKRNLKVKNKEVIISGIRDKEMILMTDFLSKEMKAIKEDITMDNIISSLQEALSNNSSVEFESKDGTNIHITQKDAINLTSVHDTLNEDNQKKMRALLESSEDEYVKVLEFCSKQFNE